VEYPRSTFRESIPPKIFSSYMALMSSIIDSEPTNVEEATNHQVWRYAMMEEYHSIVKNDVWNIFLRLEGKSMVGSWWIFKIKHAADGSVEKYKARSVVKGFSQREGVDYKDTFTLVGRYASICVVICIASVMGWRIHIPQRDYLGGRVYIETSGL